jgi:raffinose/stachyose/melibiose transport system substrate-binding protein
MFISLANEIAPGKIYEAEMGEIPWTDSDLVKAMDYWKQMFSNGIMQEGALANTQYPDAHQNFTSGQAGMMLMGVWNNWAALTNEGVTNYKEAYGFEEDYETGTFLFPDINGDNQPGRPFGGPDVVVSINKSSSVPEAAWTVISWMMGEESQKLQASRLNVPAIKGIPFDDSDAVSDFARQTLTDQLAQLENAFGRREFLYPEIKTALADAMQNVALGDQTPEEAMATVEEISQSIDR